MQIEEDVIHPGWRPRWIASSKICIILYIKRNPNSMILLYYSLVHAIRIKRPRVQVLPWPLAGFVLGILEFKSSAMLVKQQIGSPPASWDS